MWVHRLLSKDPELGTGVCAACGPVDLVRKGGTLRCGIAIRQQRDSPRRHEKRGPHGLRPKETTQQKADAACEICGSTERLNVDHCHVTLRLRGILCHHHNLGLGFFHDSVDELEAAIAYLRRYSGA